MNDATAGDVLLADVAAPGVGIAHVIVHDLVKAKNRSATVALRDQENKVTPLVQRVVDTLVREYRHRASKSHGRFIDDPENAPVPARIRQYAIDKSLEFVPLTHAMMATLRDRADAQSGATGGHVLMAHVQQDNGDEGLLIAVLTEEIGAALTEAMDLEESRYLNMKGFRYAGRVDLTGLAADAERCVSFLRGSGKEVSDYFKIFLGCDTTIVALKETQKLAGALRAFASTHSADEAQRTRFLRDANEVCVAMAKAGELFEVEAFANRMWPAAPDVLITALEDPAIGLSAGFVPHRTGLKDLVKFSGSKPGLWKVEFERQAIANGDVIFDERQNTLTFVHLPDDLVARLREEFTVDA